MTPLLQARGLIAQRSFGPPIGPLDLTVSAGEWIAMVGPNGGGKTTLLRALLGLDEPRSGSLHYAGTPLPRGLARMPIVSAVLQDEQRTLLTVRELVALGLGHEHAPTREELRHMDSLLTLLGVQALANVATTRLSGGEWQRVRLARALVPAPRVLMLDEPTNHLDPAARHAVVDILRAKLGSGALVCATHDSNLSDKCDRVLHVDHGVTVLRSECLGSSAYAVQP